MDVTEASARREVEQLQRLLKQREEEHSEELERTRKRYRESVDEVKEGQDERLDRVRQKAADEVREVQDRYRDSAEKAKDSFEKTIQEERKDAYDRYGRLSRENALDRARADDTYKAEVENLTEANKKFQDLSQKNRDDHAKRTQDLFEQKRSELEDYLAKSRESRDRAHERSLSESAADVRRKLDENTQRTAEEIRNLKSDHGLRTEKLAHESRAERDALTAAHQLREKQLIDAKADMEKKASGDLGGTLSEYKARAAEAFQRQSEDSRFFHAQREQRHAEEIAKMRQEDAAKTTALTSQYKKAADEYKERYENEKTKAGLKEGLNERRHQHEVFLNSDSADKRHNISMNQMRENYREQLSDLNETYSKNQKKYQDDAKRRIEEQDLKAAAEAAQLKREKGYQATESSIKTDRYKQLSEKRFQDRYESLDDLRQRQLEDQRRHYAESMQKQRDDQLRELATNNRDNQTKLYREQQNLVAKTNEYDTLREMDKEALTDAFTKQTRHVEDTYRRSLNKQQQSHEEATEQLRQEGLLLAHRLKGDADHDMQMQLMELRAKNRALANSWEAKNAQMKDEHTEEMDKLKSDHEKELREIMRKSREMVDNERRLHTRELEVRELQAKEKLKVQEESFREQIERLRRTNELAMKKNT